jgi:hypothetical protein
MRRKRMQPSRTEPEAEEELGARSGMRQPLMGGGPKQATNRTE